MMKQKIALNMGAGAALGIQSKKKRGVDNVDNLDGDNLGDNVQLDDIGGDDGGGGFFEAINFD